MEKSKVEITATKRYNEKFFPFALAAATLLLLELIGSCVCGGIGVIA